MSATANTTTAAPTTVPITLADLGLAATLVLLLAALVRRERLGLARPVLVSAGRMAVQLLLVGLVLKVLFERGGAIEVALVALVMVLVAGREIVARQHRRLAGWWGFGTGALTLFIAAFAVTVYGLAAIVGPEPWYQPRYAIPLLGMVLGNTMTGVALAMDRMTTALWQNRAVIEQRLLLGETAAEAVGDLRRESLRAGLTPVINGMATAGIVSLPGMMTGQILAGSPPTEAVRYQILIWLLIAAGSGFGMLAATAILQRRLFDPRERLRLDRLQTTRSSASRSSA